MALPHRSDLTGLRLPGPRLLDGVTLAEPRTVLPDQRPYTYAGDGGTTADVPLAPAPRVHGCAWPALCLHDAPPDPWTRFSAPPEWQHEFAAEPPARDATASAPAPGQDGDPPDQECPDCESPAGRWCYPWCPRFHDDPDGPFEEAQAGDHPDDF